VSERPCRDEHCVTCADAAVEMRVVEAPVDDLTLCADDAGRPVVVMTELVGGVRPGARVLVHAGVALAVTKHREDST
jgi:hypothetical protein